MKKLSAGNAAIATLACFVLGCQGLTVNLSADPNRATPGQSVKWTVSVRNDTECTTVDEIVDPPDIPDTPLPSTAGAVALVLGFSPRIDEMGAAEICRLIQSCGDLSCINTRVEEAIGPDAAAALRARVQSGAAQEPGPTAAACQELSNDSDGVALLCSFEVLSPGETDTAMFTTTAPDTGSLNAAQLAVAFAPATGDDCRPGFQIGGDEWILGGCFPRESTSAPILSPLATGAGAIGLLLIGTFGLRRRRRT